MDILASAFNTKELKRLLPIQNRIAHVGVAGLQKLLGCLHARLVLGLTRDEQLTTAAAEADDIEAAGVRQVAQEERQQASGVDDRRAAHRVRQVEQEDDFVVCCRLLELGVERQHTGLKHDEQLGVEGQHPGLKHDAQRIHISLQYLTCSA